MPSPFDADTAVTPIASGVYRCQISAEHWVVNGPNGGYLAALLTRAGDAHVADPARQLRSLSVHYLRPPVAGTAEIDVVSEQQGRSVTFLRLTMRQNDKQMLIGLGVWASAREGLEVGAWPMPVTRPPEESPPLSTVRPGGTILVHKQWDIRSISGSLFAGAKVPELVWWIRPPVHRPLDAPMLVAIADVFPPAIFAAVTTPMSAPTVDLTVHVRTDLAPVRWEPGDWILGRFVTRLAHGGFLEEDGELWTAGGTLLAHSRQLALTR
jgi:acyl-CoA thioesterase